MCFQHLRFTHTPPPSNTPSPSHPRYHYLQIIFIFQCSSLLLWSCFPFVICVREFFLCAFLTFIPDSTSKNLYEWKIHIRIHIYIYIFPIFCQTLKVMPKKWPSILCNHLTDCVHHGCKAFIDAVVFLFTHSPEGVCTPRSKSCRFWVRLNGGCKLTTGMNHNCYWLFILTCGFVVPEKF